jgi:hypothetical protein
MRLLAWSRRPSQRGAGMTFGLASRSLGSIALAYAYGLNGKQVYWPGAGGAGNPFASRQPHAPQHGTENGPAHGLSQGMQVVCAPARDCVRVITTGVAQAIIAARRRKRRRSITGSEKTPATRHPTPDLYRRRVAA